jgi:hypothetical protein
MKTKPKAFDKQTKSDKKKKSVSKAKPKPFSSAAR